MTIKEAIIATLKKEKKPMTAQEIYDSIVKNNLYTFGAKSPVAIVSSEIRKHCEGIDLKTSKSDKFFKLDDKNKFNLI